MLTGSALKEVRTVSLTAHTGKSIKFNGSLVAQVSSNTRGSAVRWTELELYITEGGKFVAKSVGRSTVGREADIVTFEVHKSLDDAMGFFKVGGRATWLTMALMDQVKKVLPSERAKWVD